MTERTQWDHASKKRVPSCKYNPGVCCDTPYPAACAGCGWTPAVAAKRVNKILEKGVAKSETIDN